MNLLAHAHLSFNQPEILIGNMISDFVKGKSKFEYTPKIQNGIMLHRAIDAFTDDHPATRQAKLYLKPSVNQYAGAFVDVAFDHFLAIDPIEFTPALLQQTADDTYRILNNYSNGLPHPFRQMLPYMTEQNWLFNYSNLDGTEKAFAGVAHRARYLPQGSYGAFELFKIHYTAIQSCYESFFPSVKKFAKEYLLQIT